MKATQVKTELYNAIIFIQESLDSYNFSDSDEQIHIETIRGIYEAINLIDEHIINND
jgi:hypothetical protein